MIVYRCPKTKERYHDKETMGVIRADFLWYDVEIGHLDVCIDRFRRLVFQSFRIGGIIKC